MQPESKDMAEELLKHFRFWVPLLEKGNIGKIEFVLYPTHRDKVSSKGYPKLDSLKEAPLK